MSDYTWSLTVMPTIRHGVDSDLKTGYVMGRIDPGAQNFYIEQWQAQMLATDEIRGQNVIF